jgi:hypothetical protein
MDKLSYQDELTAAHTEVQMLLVNWGMRGAEPGIVIPFTLVRLLVCLRDIHPSEESFLESIEDLGRLALQTFEESQKETINVH